MRRLSTVGNIDPARLAHHARHAKRPDVALTAETAAARRAAAVGSHREAAAHYRRAAEDALLHASPAEHINLLLALALQENGIGRDEHARAAAERALQVSIALGDPTLHAASARILSRLEIREERAYQLARLAVDLSESVDGGTAVRAAAYANLANNRMLARDFVESTANARRALALAEAANDVDSEIIAAHVLGTVQLLDGDLAGEAMVRRAIHLAAAHGNEPEVGRAYANLVSAAGEAREYALSARAAREALSYFTARDLDGAATYVQAWNARCMFEQGRWAEAEEELAPLTEADASINAITRLIAFYISGRLGTRRGDADAFGWLQQADALASTMNSLQRVAPVLAAQAEAHWLGGPPVDTDRLRRTYQLALARSIRGMAGELGFWLWRLGELPNLDETAASPFLLHARGEHHAAADAWLAFGCPYEAADALGDSDSEADLRRALDIFGALGAAPQWQRAAQRLRARGVRSVPRQPRVGTPRTTDGLTPREVEVLGWLVRGHSDAQIADRLHLSVRTVEHHVAAVLRKKNASSRRELRTF